MLWKLVNQTCQISAFRHVCLKSRENMRPQRWRILYMSKQNVSKSWSCYSNLNKVFFNITDSMHVVNISPRACVLFCAPAPVKKKKLSYTKTGPIPFRVVKDIDKTFLLGIDKAGVRHLRRLPLGRSLESARHVPCACSLTVAQKINLLKASLNLCIADTAMANHTWHKCG